MPSSLDNLAQNALSTGNGGNPTITGISITTTNPTARDMAVTLAVGAPDSGDAIGGTPDFDHYNQSNGEGHGRDAGCGRSG